jgi:hypothetical protein
MFINKWNYEDTEKALTVRPVAEISKEINRTPQAIAIVRNLAKSYQKGNTKYITHTMQSHFQRFYNKGNGELVTEQVAKTPEAAPEKSVDTMINELDEMFEQLKNQVTKVVVTSVQTQNEKILTELNNIREEVKDFREYKVKADKELEELRAFKEHAKSSNFAATLHKLMPHAS